MHRWIFYLFFFGFLKSAYYSALTLSLLLLEVRKLAFLIECLPMNLQYLSLVQVNSKLEINAVLSSSAIFKFLITVEESCKKGHR